MRNVLLIDYSRNFLEDLQRNLLINERDDINITMLDSIDQVDNYIYSYNYDIVVIYAGFAESREWLFDIPVRSYARKMTDIELSKKYRIRCYGIIKRSSELIDNIMKDNLNLTSSFEDTERPTNVLTSDDIPDHLKDWTEPAPAPKKEKKVNVPSYQVSDNSLNTQKPQVNQNPQPQQTQQPQSTVVRPLYNEYTGEKIIYDDEVDNTQSVQQSTQPSNQGGQSYQQNTYSQQSNSVQNTYQTQQNIPNTDYQSVQPQNQLVPVQKPQYSYYPSFQGQQPSFADQYGNLIYEVIKIAPLPDNITVQNTEMNNGTEDPKEELPGIADFAKEIKPEDVSKKLQYKATDRFKKYEEDEKAKAKELAEAEFEKDMGHVKKDAKCITVYSAKGGVGKTTISCELASFLALTSYGRGKYKVCIADFNIDFGDVMTTLEFDQRGATMTSWADDIKNRIARGELPEDINYTKSEMEVWLQKKEETGLYALLAPTNNVDSMDIGEDEIRVMVDNLCKNGDFDFVICDTGNNTRDSSFIALEKADIVMMIVTQDVTTANCNNSFLQTAERINFDMNKIKLIINMVRPAKIVGIAPEELETAFINKSTRRPYRFETLAKIKQSNDVVKYSNKGEPLVYDSNHDFTKSIGEIVKRITGQERVLAAPQKESLFERVFKKR